MSELGEIGGLVRPTPGKARPVLQDVTVPVGPVRRLVQADIDEWLLGRLESRWPDLFSPATWRAKFGSWISGNDFLCVTNDRCVLLMQKDAAHAVTGKAVVKEVFALSRDAYKVLDEKGVWTGNWTINRDDNEGRAALTALYRAGLEWTNGMRGARTITGTCSDFPPSTIKAVTGGYYIVDVLAK
jgi:hypothetical protein